MSVGELERASSKGSGETVLRETTAAEVRASLLERREIALLDVREEAHHAEGHPLFAANLALSRLELDAHGRLPRRGVPIVLFDDGEGHAAVAAQRLTALGYTDVSRMQGGLQGWRDAGFEIFRDVNSPSKAFGELVESQRHTPSLSAQEVKELIDSHADVVIVDARRFDEFQTMSIPTAISAPGGELVYRLQGLALRPATRVIVNCAGRTRSILGTQSLLNAGLPNPVSALRNGTIGWKLAQYVLDAGATGVAPEPDAPLRSQAAAAARQVADATRVRRISLDKIADWLREASRTIYLFDVRTPEEFARSHLPGFRSAPGGQLAQETDMFAPVRGARIVLADSDGVRANMAASWLAQMNWEVYVLDGLTPEDFTAKQDDTAAFALLPEVPPDATISATTLHRWIDSHAPRLSPEASPSASQISVLDFSPSRQYSKGHIPSAWFALRSRLEEALQATAESDAYVVTAGEDAAARLAWRDLRAATPKPVYYLAGGNAAWRADRYPLDPANGRFASPPIDYYRRPYEGTDASPAAMQAYLDWEFGLVEQLKRDATHGFWVLE